MSNPIECSLKEFQPSDIKLPDDSKQWDDFLIGRGGFANVYEIRVKILNVCGDTETVEKRKAAFKRFRYDKFTKNQTAKDLKLENLKREANIVHRISHPNIIQLYGVCYDHQFFGLLLELCQGGSLGSVCRSIKRVNTIALRVLANWAHQISSAMNYLADRNYIHRDLKADNVLVKEPACFCSESETTPLDWCQICERRPLNKLQLKITDFGLSKTTMSVGDSVVGTLVWLAPEVFQTSPGHSNWTEFSDVWSFGVVLWEILAREMPHAGAYPVVIAQWNQEGQTLQLKEDWPQKWKEIMEKCWSLTPTHRPTFQSLVDYFEDYTKGLVEVHVSDLPPKKQESKRKSTCCLPEFKSENEQLLNSGSSLNTVQKEKSFGKKQRICCLLSLFFIIITSIAAFIVFIYLREVYSPCSKGYTLFPGSENCYRIFIPPATYERALLDCRAEGGDLASIHSSAENSFLLNLYNKTLYEHRFQNYVVSGKGLVWIGGEFDQFEKKLVWNDGTKFNFNSNFEYFVETIDFLHTSFQFLLMVPDRKGKWKISEENESASYACKKSIIDPLTMESKIKVKTCSEGYTWKPQTGFCYKVNHLQTSFQAASAACADDNARIASISSETEHGLLIKLYKTLIIREFKKYAYDKRTHLWIDLTFNNSTGKWQWGDKTPLNYTNWALGYPNFKAPENYWAAIDIEDYKPSLPKLDKWLTVGSPNFFAYVCKKPDESVKSLEIYEKPTLPTPKIIKDHPIRNCSEGFTYFRKTGFCYKQGKQKATFAKARQACANETSELVSIHSEEENQFVKTLGGKDGFPIDRFYIGLVYKNNRWEWLDETPVDYSNWVISEPNHLYQNPLKKTELWTSLSFDTVGTRNLKQDRWNNELQTIVGGFVCKKQSTAV